AVAGQQPETLPGAIVLHGFSMGAAIALLTPPHAAVAAIVADSPYARLDEILRRFVNWALTEGSTSWSPSLRRLRRTFPLLAWATVAMSRIVFRLRFGHALVARPDTSFKRWRARSKAPSRRNCIPILLIHGAKDESVPIMHAHRIAAQAQAHSIPLETYYVEDATHCGAYGYDPQR